MKFLKPKERIVYFILMLLVAVFTFVYGLMTGNDYLNGFGVGLGTVSIIFLIKTIFVLRNPEKLKELEIKEADERNVMITNYAFAVTFRLSVLIQAFAVIIFAIINKVYISEIIALFICIQLIIFLIGFYIFSKKN